MLMKPTSQTNLEKIQAERALVILLLARGTICQDMVQKFIILWSNTYCVIIDPPMLTTWTVVCVVFNGWDVSFSNGSGGVLSYACLNERWEI